MTKFRIIGAAALSLVLAGPALAAGSVGGYRMQGMHYQPSSLVVHRMPAQDSDHFDFGIARPTYHSGWGGPYGDGDYPGSVDENMGPPFR